MSCGGKQQGSKKNIHRVYTSPGSSGNKGTDLVPVYPRADNICLLPPSGKQHCLPSAIRELTEQYWRLEAAAATAHTQRRGEHLLKSTVYCSLNVSPRPGVSPGRGPAVTPDAPHKFPELSLIRCKTGIWNMSVNFSYRSRARNGVAPLLCLDINPGERMRTT